MHDYEVRINGSGNAWPVFPGSKHPYYNSSDAKELSNASFSILRTPKGQENRPDAEIVIDAGHGTVQHIIQDSKRTPDALVLTHPHLDHTLGADWIIQGYYRQHEQPMPVYASEYCQQVFLESYPHLGKMIAFHPLIPGQSMNFDCCPSIQLTPYPVYHGLSAFGAMMLNFSFPENKNCLFTGDILLPLIRGGDIPDIQSANWLFTDSNNRFPYPKSNHWSITSVFNQHKAAMLKDFLKELSLSQLLLPHLVTGLSRETLSYFDEWLGENIHSKEYEKYTSVIDFCQKVQPENVVLVHYGGAEDLKYYKKDLLNASDLVAWASVEAKENQVTSSFHSPVPLARIPVVKHTDPASL